MYDFTAAVEMAQSVVDRAEGKGSVSYRFPLVYPQSGQSMTIRPLFNPKSGQILRLVNRHEKVPCYRTYGVECPICKIQQQVKDLLAQNPFARKSESKSRGIMFAQLVSSTVPIEKGNNQGYVQPGDIILFMHPWSVYSAINTQIQAIAQTGAMEQAFSHADSGLYIQVSVTTDFKYTTTAVPYMTFNPKGLSDEDFGKLLDSLDDIRDQVVPREITEDVSKAVQEYADEIARKYLSVAQAAPTTVPPSNPVNMNTPVVPQSFVAPTSVPAVAPAVAPVAPVVQQQPVAVAPVAQPVATAQPAAAKPECYGNHDENSTKCVCCPMEVMCAEQKLPF